LQGRSIDSRSRFVSRLQLGLIITACVASLVLGAVRRAHVSSRAAFEQIAEQVRAEYRQGDLIVVVPFHQSTPRLLLGDLPLVEPRIFEPLALQTHERLLLVSVDAIGGRADLVHDIESLGAVTEIAKADGVRFARIDVATPLHVRWHLDAAGTSTTVGDGPHACVTRHGSVPVEDTSASSLLVGFGLPYASRRVSERLRVGNEQLEVTHDWQVREVPFASEVWLTDGCVDIWAIE
jgi:hypothetical protein